ncbi:G patch domain-containing protein 3 [Orchesella cincta]|uniref:G patch domain-containing protein 3 n=1 Tax=Orchesella cincta TaxID=48709 RepID=A0A1D2N1M4_ORCCI|nr:G patch domain-containing protein 3 [Orchesella cincta]
MQIQPTVNLGNHENASVRKSPYFYCILHNIPPTFRTSDLRNFFAEFIHGEKFDLFHFRHRPQTVNIVENKVDDDKKVQVGSIAAKNNASAQQTTLKKFCCVIRFSDDGLRSQFVKHYHMKFWMNKDGNDLPTRCVISKANLGEEDLRKFSSKELHPPKFMPRGNVGTPNEHFLNLIRECRLPPSLIKKLGLEFPRARVFKRYSKVPHDYGTNLVYGSEEDEEDEVKTGKGHNINDWYLPKVKKSLAQIGNRNQAESDNESNADDDDDRCEEWERHEALHDHRTTHGDVTSESKERLYESEIELQWEKGGPGLVWYTDAQFWDQQRGNFDEKNTDDWDVDMEVYYEPGGGDKDSHDLMDIRRSQRIQNGLETISVIKAGPSSQPYRRQKIKIDLGNNKKEGVIGEFEKHTRGIGRKVMEKFGWKDGDGLGSTIKGIPDALEGEGQAPADKRGFGYYGEKLDLGNPTKRQRGFRDYDLQSEGRVVIGTIYDKPEDLDVPDQLKRRNAPTFIKRYEFYLCIMVESKPSTPQEASAKPQLVAEHVNIQITPDEQTFLVRTLLNFEAPHYFARFTVFGCPPGLEILDKYEHLVINRRLQNFIDLAPDRRLLAYSQFDIKNSRGMQLYIALEKVKKSSLRWVRDARLFEVSFFDFHCRRVFTVRRKCGLRYTFAQYCCLACTFGFKGCGNIAEVYIDSDNTKLGSIKQKMSYPSTILHICNKKGKCIMIINGVIEDGVLDVFYPGEEEPIAMIETLLNHVETFDFYRVAVPKCSSPFGITFFKAFIPPEQKALLLSAVILLEYITLKPNSDYPTIAEVIPDDFQDFALPFTKVHRDGSRELHILTERKRRKHRKKSLIKGGYGCCIWCGQLMCLCCLLAMKRNALRFLGLFLVIMYILFVLVNFIRALLPILTK